MRHVLLKLFFVFFVLSQSFSLGLGFHADAGYASVSNPTIPGSNSVGSLGIDIGFLTPYFLDVIVSISAGTINDRIALMTTYTLHYTGMLTNNVGVFVGIGLGIDSAWGLRFDQYKRDPLEANQAALITRALFPLGVKYFLTVGLELYAEVAFGVGMYQSWTQRYTTPTPSPQHISADVYERSFYWDVYGRVGLRWWY